MQNNPFDTLGSYDQNLDGILKKARKAVKAVTRPVEKAANKVRAKTLPKSVNVALSKAAKNPYVRAAAAAIATVYTAGLASAVLGVGGGSALTAKTIAVEAVKGVGKQKAKRVVEKKIAKKTMKKFAAEEAAILAEIEIEKNAQRAANNAQAIATSPEFSEMIMQMSDAGASKKKIEDTWAQSDTFKDVVTQNAANTVYPQLKTSYEKAGLNKSDAEALAKDDALKIGAKAADDASLKANPWPKILPLVVPVATALIMGA